MMSRSIIIGVMIACLMVVGLGAQITSAQNADSQTRPMILTDAQLDGIRSNCTTSKIALGRVHAVDGVMRVNLGQDYANLAGRLMAPMNSRIGLAGKDNVELSRITADFNSARSDFVQAYGVYDDQVTEVLGINCSEDPAGYYAGLIAARQQRSEVQSEANRIKVLAQRYFSEFRAFARDQERQS